MTGEDPDQLKIVKVIPIYKTDDDGSFSNYRPVSVLPCFSKIHERLIFKFVCLFVFCFVVVFFLVLVILLLRLFSCRTL